MGHELSRACRFSGVDPKGGWDPGGQDSKLHQQRKTLRMSVRKHHVLVVYSYPGKVSDTPIWA